MKERKKYGVVVYATNLRTRSPITLFGTDLLYTTDFKVAAWVEWLWYGLWIAIGWRDNYVVEVRTRDLSPDTDYGRVPPCP